MKFKMIYTLYVWLVGVLIGSMINYWGYFFFVDDSVLTTKIFMGALSAFPFSIWICIVLSFPAYLLLWLISYLISIKTSLSTLKIKGWVAFVAVLLFALTFVYFGALNDAESVKMFLCFVIPLVGSAYYFKLRDEVSGEI